MNTGSRYKLVGKTEIRTLSRISNSFLLGPTWFPAALVRLPNRNRNLLLGNFVWGRESTFRLRVEYVSSVYLIRPQFYCFIRFRVCDRKGKMIRRFHEYFYLRISKDAPWHVTTRQRNTTQSHKYYNVDASRENATPTSSHSRRETAIEHPPPLPLTSQMIFI